MRIVCWNVNGLRTLKGYQPWYALTSWEACLEELRADIACFQEVKMTRRQLQYSMCAMDKYEGFFDLHPTKGYAGTVTYVRRDICMPSHAQVGITGRSSSEDACIGAEAYTVRETLAPLLYNALDQEGRCVVLDCGLFVLMNVYAPNETGPERVEYKMAFYHVLEERVRELQRNGREVLVVGDLNVVADVMDHCEGTSVPPSEFYSHPARSWFRALIGADGPLIDMTRECHRGREKMYTCWNTLINARPSNYGTRLDYTLITPGLRPWILTADIEPHVHGSDHCPVVLELRDSLKVRGETRWLVDELRGRASRTPCTHIPRLASSQMDEFCARKQPRLADLFGAQQKQLAIQVPSEAVQDGTGKTVSVPPVQEVGPSQSATQLSAAHTATKRAKAGPKLAGKTAKRSAQPTLQTFLKRKKDESEKVQVPSSIPAPECLSEFNTECTMPASARSPDRQRTAEQWSALFTPQPPPLCFVHGEPARSYIVNKPGINQGRKFWLCSRPVGPGWENKSRRGDADPTYRCDYFAWDTDVKRRRRRC